MVLWQLGCVLMTEARVTTGPWENGLGTGKLVLPLADCCNGKDAHAPPGELAPVVWVWKSCPRPSMVLGELPPPLLPATTMGELAPH